MNEKKHEYKKRRGRRRKKIKLRQTGKKEENGR